MKYIVDKKRKIIKHFNGLNETIQTRYEEEDLVNTPLYHFTKFNTFEQIIKSKCLQLTSFDRMNDSKEIMFAKNYMNRVLASYNGKYCRDFLHKFEFFLKAVNVYVICFCLDKENTHLWDKYGDNHKGLALGFRSTYSKHESIDYTKDWPQVIIKVKYGEKEISQDLLEYISTFARLLQKTKTKPEYLTYVRDFVSNFYLCMPRYKANIWKHEMEHRWCMMDRGPAKKILPKCIINDKAIIENVVYDKLDEIIIGKNCAWNESDVRDLLNSNGYKASIKIIKI